MLLVRKQFMHEFLSALHCIDSFKKVGTWSSWRGLAQSSKICHRKRLLRRLRQKQESERCGSGAGKPFELAKSWKDVTGDPLAELREPLLYVTGAEASTLHCPLQYDRLDLYAIHTSTVPAYLTIVDRHLDDHSNWTN